MYKFSCSKQKICCIYSGTWELGTPKGLRKTVLNSEVVLFLRSICVYWMGLGTWVAVLNSQVVPISQVVAKTGFAVHDNRNYSHFLCIINSAVVFNELFQNTVIYSDIYLSHLFVNFMPLLPLLSNSHKVISFGMCQILMHTVTQLPYPPPLNLVTHVHSTMAQSQYMLWYRIAQWLCFMGSKLACQGISHEVPCWVSKESQQLILNVRL